MTNSSEFLRKVKEGSAADLLTDSDTQHLDLLITDTQVGTATFNACVVEDVLCLILWNFSLINLEKSLRML